MTPGHYYYFALVFVLTSSFNGNFFPLHCYQGNKNQNHKVLQQQELVKVIQTYSTRISRSSLYQYQGPDSKFKKLDGVAALFFCYACWFSCCWTYILYRININSFIFVQCHISYKIFFLVRDGTKFCL